MPISRMLFAGNAQRKAASKTLASDVCVFFADAGNEVRLLGKLPSDSHHCECRPLAACVHVLEYFRRRLSEKPVVAIARFGTMTASGFGNRH